MVMGAGLSPAPLSPGDVCPLARMTPRIPHARDELTLLFGETVRMKAEWLVATPSYERRALPRVVPSTIWATLKSDDATLGRPGGTYSMDLMELLQHPKCRNMRGRISHFFVKERFALLFRVERNECLWLHWLMNIRVNEIRGILPQN